MPGVKLLIADDDRVFREFMRMKLESPLVNVITAQDGDETLRRIRAQAPDMLLMDVRMPGLSGFEVCRILRDDARTVNLPILLMTVESDLSEKLEGFRCGADEYICKPIDFNWLQRRLVVYQAGIQRDWLIAAPRRVSIPSLACV